MNSGAVRDEPETPHRRTPSAQGRKTTAARPVFLDPSGRRHVAAHVVATMLLCVAVLVLAVVLGNLLGVALDHVAALIVDGP